MKRLLTCLLALLVMASALSALADEPPYNSFAFSPSGSPFYMQTPYLPTDLIGQTLYDENHEKVKGFTNPADMQIDEEGFIYVCDRGASRVVKITLDGTLIAEYGLGQLKSPEGLFVTAQGDLFVADTGNARILVMNPEGEVIRSLTCPNDVRVAGIMFSPTDVAVDERGYLYLLLKGSNEGLMIMSPEGRFQGYFGRNNTQLNLAEKFKRMIYTDAQIATNSNAVAPSVTGMFISRDSYIYTCTSTLTSGQIKKFNASGTNLFANVNTQVEINRAGTMSAVSSLFVDDDGVIYAIDNTNGSVILYDAEGTPLLKFGEKLTGNERRIGYFSNPVAISVTEDGKLLVLDSAYNGIHVFTPTTLTGRILTAVSQYNDGRYQDAREDWENILKSNANYYWANLGLGKIAYNNKDWKEAMRQMRLAENQEDYSDALWKMRAEVVQRHAATVVVVLIIAWAVLALFRKIFKVSVFTLIGRFFHLLHKWLVEPIYRLCPPFARLMGQIRYSFKMMCHPVDVIYETTRRDQGSLVSAAVLYVIFVVVMILERALTNFVFDLEGIRGVSLVSVLLLYCAPVVLWIAGNYLVGSITKGQGSLRGIIISTVYALMPLIVLTLPLALLSNVLTLAEGSIYWICRVVIYLWTALMLFIQVKEIHGYEFGETVKNILWILFVDIMAVIAIVAVSGIMVQAYNFLNEFIRELLGYV